MSEPTHEGVAASGHPCPNGDDCALNKGASHCFACRRNWPRDETWDVPFEQRPIRECVAAYTFRVEGIEEGHRSYDKPFDETYGVEGEHPADALAKLVGEIEWGILDSERGFTITFLTETGVFLGEESDKTGEQ